MRQTKTLLSNAQLPACGTTVIRGFAAWGAVLLAAGLLTGSLGCAREHMRADYGERTRAFYAAQQIYTEAEQKRPSGLDSEEAAIAHATYRKNLGGGAKGSANQGAQVLLVQESKDNDRHK